MHGMQFVRHADEFWVSRGGLKGPILVILGDHEVSGTAIWMTHSAVRIVIWDPPGNSASSSTYGF